MKSLGLRVLLLVAGFSLTLAVVLAVIAGTSFRSYFVDVIAQRAASFVERILETHPDIWQAYRTDPARFGERLREFVLYEPNTGLYLLDTDGRVLASAGEGKIFWSSYRVDLGPLRQSAAKVGTDAIMGEDPDTGEASCVVAGRPIMDNGNQVGWLYVVARNGVLGAVLPERLKNYVVRDTIKITILTLAIGGMLTVVIIAALARPLAQLTRVTERVRESGFSDPLCDNLFPCSERPDEIGRLSKSFRSMFERLKQETERVTQTDARRREMVASVSHDLRTPLTALMGQLETIRLKGEALGPVERERFLDGAMRNAQHLKRLTDALAELAKLDNPELHIETEPTALGELADDVAHRFQAQAREVGIALSVVYPDGLPRVSVDAGLVERALSNLLDNAFRVTPAGGRIEVRISPAGERVRVEVCDTGPGVAAEDQEHVFDRFYQTAKHREQRGSSGLGLAIVKRVAELHRGVAGLVSAPGTGATFFLDFPSPGAPA